MKVGRMAKDAVKQNGKEHEFNLGSIFDNKTFQN